MEKFSSFLKVPSLFVEILNAFSGAFLLLLVNLLVPFDLSKINNFNNIGHAEFVLLFIVTSYIIGNLLVIISNFWISFIVLFFKKNRLKKLVSWWSKFIEFSNPKGVKNLKSDPTDLYYSELFLMIKDEPELKDEIERLKYKSVIKDSLLGICIIISVIVLRWWMLFPLFLITMEVIEDNMDEVKFWDEIAEIAERKRHNVKI